MSKKIVIKIHISKNEILLIDRKIRREEAKRNSFFDGRNAPRTFTDKKKEISRKSCRGKMTEEQQVKRVDPRPSGEGFFDSWGQGTCGHTGPLHKGQCASCAAPRAFLPYQEQQPKNYLPVTGWEKVSWYRRCVLYGYIHEGRTREGWETLIQEAEKDDVTNLILGRPEKVLSISEREED